MKKLDFPKFEEPKTSILFALLIGLFLASLSHASQYQIIEGSFSWYEAKADAEARGGRLAILNTQATIDSLNQLLDATETWPYLWIGATDEVQEGVWRWITGEIMTVENWRDGEPNNLGGEDYAMVRASKDDRRGEWNDAPGNANFYGFTVGYLLELLTPLPPVLAGFPPLTEPLPGSTLTLDATATSGYPAPTYQWFYNDSPIPEAAGGTNPVLSLAATIFPVIDGTYKCVATNSKGSAEIETYAVVFQDDDSDGLSNYREDNITLTDKTDPDSDDDGLLDGTELQSRSYELKQDAVTWYEAKTLAETAGGYLATVTSQSEWSDINDSIPADWVGSFWLGATDEVQEGDWKWITGETWSFSNWSEGQPDNLSNEDYLEMYSPTSFNGVWNDLRNNGILSHQSSKGYLIEFDGTNTDPLDADSDDDGLSDGEEVNVTNTDPNDSDSDDDNLTDYEEVTTHSSDPNLVDSDADGLTDYDEVTTYLTSPSSSDTDGDGLSDFDEINTYPTDPLVNDSDGDGLNDGDEILIHSTNPLLVDSDGDNFTDKFEIETGFDPTSQGDMPDAYSEVTTAIEFSFFAELGFSYRIETSLDLNSWTSIESGIQGNGGRIDRLYSMRDQPRRFFRATKETTP